jgi:hypothetical protein
MVKVTDESIVKVSPYATDSTLDPKSLVARQLHVSRTKQTLFYKKICFKVKQLRGSLGGLKS